MKAKKFLLLFFLSAIIHCGNVIFDEDSNDPEIIDNTLLNVNIIDVVENSASFTSTITFQTDIECLGSIEYYDTEDDSFIEINTDTFDGLNHSGAVDNLIPNSLYDYTIIVNPFNKEYKQTKKESIFKTNNNFKLSAITPIVAESSVNRWRSVAGDNTVLCAISDSDKPSYSLIRSTDNGKTWQPNDKLDTNTNWFQIDYGNDTFIAIGVYDKNKIARSIDKGINWSYVSITPDDNLRGLGFGNNTWLACPHSTLNYIFRSTDDGQSWSQITLPEAAACYNPKYGNGIWIMPVLSYANDYNLYRSVDNGISWTGIETPIDVSWCGVAYGNGVWVMMSLTDGKCVRSINNGLTWEEVIVPELSEGSIVDIKYVYGMFIAVSYNGNFIITSKDGGLNWNKHTTPISAEWFSIAPINRKIIVSARNSGNMIYFELVDE